MVNTPSPLKRAIIDTKIANEIEVKSSKEIELGVVDKANLISEDEVNAILANAPAPLITKEYMKSRIANIEFTRMKGTVMHCQITLDNGYSTSGEAACVSPENFNKELGQKMSYENAFDKLWSLFGFLLAEKLYLKTKI